MYNRGDLVDIIYTGEEYANGIPTHDIHKSMKNNPHIVDMVGKNWVSLVGNAYYWGNQLIMLANREPDWEV